MTINKFKRSEWRERQEGSGEYCSVKYGYCWVRGNTRPHFSITMDTAEEANEQNRTEEEAIGPGLPEGKEYRLVEGGVMPEEIRRIFPELAEMLPWHLSDDEGAPMHYVENGVYWARMALGMNGKIEGGQPQAIANYMSTIVFGALPGDELRNLVPPINATEAQKTEWLAGLPDRLNQRLGTLAMAMLEVMRRHGVEGIDVSQYPEWQQQS